jgi:hypothetical protein
LRSSGEAGKIKAALSRRFKARLMAREAPEVNRGPLAYSLSSEGRSANRLTREN